MMRYQDVLSNTRLLILFVAFLVVSGLSAYSSLPRAEDPSIVNRSAVIATLYPGAAATRVESLVTEVIEDKLREVSEINDMSSVSRLGVSVINIRLHEEAPNAELIWSDVRDKLADVEPYLPSGALTPDLDHDGGPAFTAIYSLGWQGPQKPDLLLLGRYAKELAKRLRNMSGTELVDEYGSPDEEILVNIHTEDALTTGYSTEQLAVAIEKADVKNSAGELTNNATRFGLELANPLDSIERIKQIPVSVDQNGYAIRVEDIAAVNRVAKTPADELAMLNGMPAVFVAARMLPSLRVDHWTPQVDKLLEEFSNELPSSIKISTVFSQRPYTEKRIFELGESLLIGLGLVLFVLLFTLGIRSACVIALALPLTLLFTLTLMKYFMVPIDQMSLTGFIVALGIMVDNAVVMVDTIRSYRMQNKSPLESAMLAVRHLWIPLASSTLTTVLAFAPVFLMPGSVGEFVSPVALTVVFSLLGSYIISHTVIAALAGVFVPDSSSALPWYQRGIQITFISRWFSRSIATAIRRPYLAVAIVSSLPILGFWSVSQLTEQFFPPADRDMFEMRVYLPPQASINATKDTTDQVNQLIMEEDGVEMIGWSIGTAFPSFYYNMAPPEHNAPFFAQAMVKVNSIETANQLIPKLQAKLDRAIPQAQIIVRKLEQGPPFNAPVELRVYGNDVEVLKEIGKDIRLILSQITDVTHTRQSLPPGIPQFELNIDEQAIKMNAMNLSDFANLLQSSLVGRESGSVLEGSESLPIRVRVEDSERENQSDLTKLRFPIQSGEDVSALSVMDLSQLKLVSGSGGITHRDGRRVNTIEGYVSAGVLPQTVLNELLVALQDYQLPTGYTIEYGGEAAERDDSVNQLAANVSVVLVLMILVVVLSFNSFRLSAVIFTVAALSAGLGILSIWLFNYPFGFTVIIALLGVVGLAINAAIVIISELRTSNEACQGDERAILTGVMSCTRHITSTTLTTIGGFLPLILSGGEFWPPFSIAIAGGTALTTLLSFYFVPAIFKLLVRIPINIKSLSYT